MSETRNANEDHGILTAWLHLDYVSETRNAKITGTQLTIEDHGILTAWLHLDYGGSGQAFGGYSLDKSSGSEGFGRSPHPCCGHFIRSVLETLDVDRWEKLTGVSCRAKMDDGIVSAIGHFLKDKWFCPREEFKKYHNDDQS